MLLADARLPTGAHTQSAGLEPAMRHGVSLADVPAYIRTRLRTVVAVEAGAAVVARHLAAGVIGSPDDPGGRVARRRRRVAGPDGQPGAAGERRGARPGLRPVGHRAVADAPASVALRAVRRPTRAVAIGVAARWPAWTDRRSPG